MCLTLPLMTPVLVWTFESVAFAMPKSRSTTSRRRSYQMMFEGETSRLDDPERTPARSTADARRGARIDLAMYAACSGISFFLVQQPLEHGAHVLAVDMLHRDEVLAVRAANS